MAVDARRSINSTSMDVQPRSKQADARLKFCDKRGSCSLADRISLLPDDILVFILSFLTVEEAAATSILSARWHQLWKLISRLDFDGTKARGKIEQSFHFGMHAVERPKYVEWVTRVLRLNKCCTLDELKIRFSLTNEFSQAIDEWIDIAISKRVPKLELNLSGRDENLFLFPCKHYTFRLLPRTLDRHGLPPFKFLETLYFSSVEVTGDDLHYFINHCPVLERLSVHGSKSLEKLHVFGFAIPLKYLEIVLCPKVEEIKICNSNLISFSYYGSKIKFLVVNVPHLVELSFTGVRECLHDFLNQVSCYLPQIRALTWSLFSPLMRILEFGVHPQLVKLNKLVLNIFIGRDDESLLGYISFLIEASPHLERLVLKLQWETHPTIRGGEGRRSVKCPHKYLKVVEMAGYYGGTGDFELGMYFIENAIVLEKVVIDPRIQYSPRGIRSPESIKCEESAGRSRAYRQLLGEVPSGVELVLL